MEESKSDKYTHHESTSPDEVRKKTEMLLDMINKALTYQGTRKVQNKRRASLIKIATIFFAGSATILLGLQISGFEKYLKEIAFVLASLVTLLNAIEPFFNFRALWIEHELAIAKFARLKNKVEFYLAGKEVDKINPKIIEQHFAEYEEIWSNTSRAWISYRRGGDRTTEENL